MVILFQFSPSLVLYFMVITYCFAPIRIKSITRAPEPRYGSVYQAEQSTSSVFPPLLWPQDGGWFEREPTAVRLPVVVVQVPG